MAKGSCILLSVPPKGVFTEGTLDGAYLPGSIVQIKAAVEPVGGRYTWELYNRSGKLTRGMIGILNYDYLQGKTETQAYSAGNRAFIYIPPAGEEFNLLVNDQSGTTGTSDFAIGDELMVDNTGQLIDVAGTAESLGHSFTVLETVNDMAADALVHVMYNG